MPNLNDRVLEGEGLSFGGHANDLIAIGKESSFPTSLSAVGPGFENHLQPSTATAGNALSVAIRERINSFARVIPMFKNGVAQLTSDSSDSVSNNMKLRLSDRDRDMMEFYPRSNNKGAGYEDEKGLGGCRIQ